MNVVCYTHFQSAELSSSSSTCCNILWGSQHSSPDWHVGSKSCRRDIPSYSCRSLHMLSLQHDSGNWSRPWEWEALSDQDRYTVIGRQPSSPIRSCWYLYQAGSADQLPSTMSSAGGRVAHEEAGWRYSAEYCEAWAWPSSLCTG